MNPLDLIPKSYRDEAEAEISKDFDHQGFVYDKRPGAYMQYMAKKLNRQIIFEQDIKEELKNYKAPIYMYDFETMKFAVPEGIEA
jgi:hypothetical protein